MSERCCMALTKTTSNEKEIAPLSIASSYSGWKEYAAIKRRKLSKQWDEQFRQGSFDNSQSYPLLQNSSDNPSTKKEDSSTHIIKNGQLSNIFEGITIYVNGYTQPTSLELRDIVRRHGGQHEYWLSKHTVTHIITTNLPDRKIDQLVRGDKVVRPEWIVKSVDAGRLLSWEDFQLYTPGKQIVGQSLLSSFFPKAKKIEKTKLHGEEEVDHLLLSKSCQTSCTTDLVSEAMPSETSIDTHSLHKSGSCTSTIFGNNELFTDHPFSQSCKMPAIPSMENASSRGVLQTEDPEFLRNFYKASRLHHLSLWKTELRQIVADAMQEKRVASKEKTNILKGNAFNTSSEVDSLAFDHQLNAFYSNGDGRIIMHVDMDSFFVSVALRDRPDLRLLPVAVSHSKAKFNAGTFGTSDVASCNYIARQFGVKNGMSIGKARNLCPSLVLVPYEFDKYKAVSTSIYSIFMRFADEIQVGSCDEAMLDVSSRVAAKLSTKSFEHHDLPANYMPHTTVATNEKEEALRASINAVALEIRNEIMSETGCTASIGASFNQLLARMCTKLAKPNGQYVLLKNEMNEFMQDKKVDELPGVGWSLLGRLKELKISTCVELQQFSISELQRSFGEKKGKMLYYFARGIDSRSLNGPLTSEASTLRKSIGAEVNWGVRFETNVQVLQFLHNLVDEIVRRLADAKMVAHQLVLKLRRRKSFAKEPGKFMGCGITDHLSRTSTLKMPVRDAAQIYSEASRLFATFHCPSTEIRGMGIQMQRLESESAAMKSKQSALVKDGFCFDTLVENEKNTLQTKYIASAVANEVPSNNDPSWNEVSKTHSLLLPATFSQIDKTIFNDLPPSIQAEIEEVYKPKKGINTSSVSLPVNSRRSNGLQAPSKQALKRPRQSFRKRKMNNNDCFTLIQMWPSLKDNHHVRTLNSSVSLGTRLDEQMEQLMPLSSISADANPLDWDWVRSLPSDIRHEAIQKNYTLSKRTKKQNDKAQSMPLNQKLSEELNLHPQEKKAASETWLIKRTKPNLMGHFVLDEVRCLLTTWITSYATPLPEDIRIVQEYFFQLINDKQLDMTQRILKHLMDTVHKVQISSWTDAINSLISHVQLYVCSIYHAPLRLSVKSI